MQIRLMNMNDYEAVFDLWKATPGMGLRAGDDSKEGIGRFLKRNPTSCFVAEADNEIIGVILAGHDGRRGYIYHTAVREKYRKQGIGSALVRQVCEALAREGISRAGLLVLKTNQTGRTFWTKRGWQERCDLLYFARSVDSRGENGNQRL